MARKYDLEFQKESLRLLYKRNGKLSEVAKSLGIPLSTLKTWEIKMGSSIKKESIYQLTKEIANFFCLAVCTDCFFYN